MHIAIIAIGTRGDVQPIVALGCGLQAAGHTVTVVSSASYADFVTRYGLGFLPLSVDPQEVMQGEDGLAWLESGANPARFVRTFRELVQPRVMTMMEETYAAAQAADVLAFTTLGYFVAGSLVEKLGIPGVGVYPNPVHPSDYMPSIMFPELDLPGGLSRVYNNLTHDMLHTVMWQVFKGMLTVARREVLDLPPMRESFRQQMRSTWLPVAYGYSQHVVPRPVDWPENVAVTGYWFLDEPDWTPPADLLDFLESGEPPVYVGFGSMANRDPEATTDIVLEALQSSGQRGLLLTGWGGITTADTPDDVFVIDSAPHSWLFPRMAAVVHHGGAGTTAAGLRAGRPSVLVPFFADQPFFGRQVERIGAGPRAIPRNDLTAARLTDAITQSVRDPYMRQRAEAVGRAIRAEDGVDTAVRFIKACLTSAG